MEIVPGTLAKSERVVNSQSQPIKAESGVMDGVRMGFGMFIILPLLIICGIVILIRLTTVLSGEFLLPGLAIISVVAGIVLFVFALRKIYSK